MAAPLDAGPACQAASSHGVRSVHDENAPQIEEGDDMFGHAWRVGRIGGIEIRIDALAGGLARGG